MLPDELMRRWKVQRVCGLQQFYSKKNEVCRVRLVTKEGCGRLVVVKRFSDEDSFAREVQLLRLLDCGGAPVPRLYYSEKGTTVSEFIEGPVLVDRIYPDSPRLIPLLVESLRRIYSQLRRADGSLILGDMNLRNFIYQRETKSVYRIDFESARAGRHEVDAGRLCAFCLSYYPPFTSEKMRVARNLYDKLVSRLDLCPTETRRWVLSELNSMRDRRQMPLPDEVVDSVRRWPV